MTLSVDPTRTPKGSEGPPKVGQAPPKVTENFGAIFQEAQTRPGTSQSYVKSDEDVYILNGKSDTQDSKIQEVKEEPDRKNDRQNNENTTKKPERKDDAQQLVNPLQGLVIELTALDIQKLHVQPRQSVQDIILKYVDRIEKSENQVKFKFKGDLEILFTRENGRTTISITAAANTINLLREEQLLLANFLQKTFTGEDIDIQLNEFENQFADQQQRQHQGQDRDQDQPDEDN